MMCSVLRRPVKAVKGPSVTSASKNSRCSSSSQLRSRWVVDRGPDLLAEAGDRGLDRWGHAGGDGEPGPRRSGRRQSRRGVVGRVRPEDHQPVPVRAAGRGRGRGGTIASSVEEMERPAAPSRPSLAGPPGNRTSRRYERGPVSQDEPSHSNGNAERSFPPISAHNGRPNGRRVGFPSLHLCPGSERAIRHVVLSNS